MLTSPSRRPKRSARSLAGGRTSGPRSTTEPVVIRTPLGAAVPAAAWSAVLGFAVVTLLVVVAWVAAPEGGISSAQVVAAGAQGWLLANLADLRLADGAISLTPLGLAMVPGYVLYRSGCWAARAADVRSWADAARTVGLLTVCYGGIAVTVAVFAVTTTTTPSVPSALVGASSLALLAGGLGVLRASGLWARLPRELPPEVVGGARAAAAGLATMVLGGAVMLAAALVAHGRQVTDLWSALGPDPAGGVLLLLLCVALVPNAVLWAAAFCVGPGFAVGVGTSVAPTGVAVGAVPALPVLGALPGAGDAPAAALVGVALPVVAGVVVGIAIARDRRLRRATPSRLAIVAACSGAGSGVTLGIVAGLSAGGVGAARMAQLGPSLAQVALVAGLELGAVAAATAWEWRRHSAHRELRGVRL